MLTDLEQRDVLFVDEIHRLTARGRGDPLSGAGGLPARHHDRRGPGRALDQARPAAVHADRRDDARGPADDAAARPLRHRSGSSSTTPDELAQIVRRSAAHPRRRDRRRRRRARSRAARAGTPRIANRLLRRVRDFAEVKADGHDHARRRARGARAARRRPARPRRDRPQAPARDHREVRRRPGRPRRRSPPRSARSRHDRGRLEPFLIQLGFLQRTPRGRIVTKLRPRPRRRTGRIGHEPAVLAARPVASQARGSTCDESVTFRPHLSPCASRGDSPRRYTADAEAGASQ